MSETEGVISGPPEKTTSNIPDAVVSRLIDLAPMNLGSDRDQIVYRISVEKISDDEEKHTTFTSKGQVVRFVKRVELEDPIWKREEQWRIETHRGIIYGRDRCARQSNGWERDIWLPWNDTTPVTSTALRHEFGRYIGSHSIGEVTSLDSATGLGGEHQVRVSRRIVRPNETFFVNGDSSEVQQGHPTNGHNHASTIPSNLFG